MPSQPQEFTSPLDGAKISLPILFVYLSIGTATGVLAVQNGMSIAEIGLLSLLLFAGSGQFVFAEIYRGAASSLAGTIFMINLRHLLYSASLAQNARRLTLAGRIAAGAQLTDESYLIATAKLGNKQIGGAGWICGMQCCCHFAWICGNLIGAASGNHIDFQVLGLDFAAPAMFIALIAMQILGNVSRVAPLATAVLAGGGVAGAALYLPAISFPILIAAISAAIGVLIFGPSKSDKKFAEIIGAGQSKGQS